MEPFGDSLGLGAYVIVALAQPRDGYEELQLARESRDIVVVLDVSQSMLAEDVLPSRMERAKWEVRSCLAAQRRACCPCAICQAGICVCRFLKSMLH